MRLIRENDESRLLLTDDGVLVTEWLRDTEIDLDHARAWMALVMDLGGRRPYLVWRDKASYSVTPEALVWLADHIARRITATAVVTPTAATARAVQAEQALVPDVPLRAFTDGDEALNWLRTEHPAVP